MFSEGSDKVGVIGLGIIGSRVADLLRASERHVYVWNRTPKPAPNFVSSPAEVAQLADVIQIFISNGEALVEIAGKMKDKLTKKHIVINNSTVDPAAAVEAYRIVNETGAAFLDVPFTGSKLAAEKGALVYYAGGEPKVLERVQSILEVSGKEVLFVGKVGEASVLKIATNMITGVTVEVLSEALGLVTSAGIEPERLQEAIAHNACGSPLTEMKLPTMIDEDFDPHFSLKHMFKDAQYALALAKDFELDLPALSTTASVMFRTMQEGNEEKDFSVLAANYPSSMGKGKRPPESSGE